MYALVESGTITKYFNNSKGFMLGDVQYSSDIFTKWSTSELEAIDIYEVVFDNSNFKNEYYYVNTDQSFAFANDTVTASYEAATPKPHADLKIELIKDLKQQVARLLQDTDWYITRNTEKSVAIPSAITTHRDAVRTKQASMETAITNASNTPALETLYTYTEQSDGTVTRPLGELPTLEI